MLDSLERECAGSAGRVALVDGPMACGKSEFLRNVVERAQRAGFLALTAHCSRTERTLPGGVLSQLVRGIDNRYTRLLDAGLLDSAIALVEHDEIASELLRVFRELCSAVLDRARETPLLLAVDDAHHMDQGSATWLLQLLRRSQSSRVLVVLTADTRLPAVPWPLHSELLRQPHFRRIELAPLSAAGVGEVVAERAGDLAAQRLTADFTAASGGNPLLLHAMIDDHLAGRTAQHHDLALLSCLQRGGPFMSDVARAVAVLGPDATTETVAALAESDVDRVGHVLRALTAGGVLHDGAFRSPQAVAAVLATAENRALMHHRAARLLHEGGAPVSAVARHLVQAEDASESWARNVLREAAEVALLEGNRASPSSAWNSRTDRAGRRASGPRSERGWPRPSGARVPARCCRTSPRWPRRPTREGWTARTGPRWSGGCSGTDESTRRGRCWTTCAGRGGRSPTTSPSSRATSNSGWATRIRRWPPGRSAPSARRGPWASRCRRAIRGCTRPRTWPTSWCAARARRPSSRPSGCCATCTGPAARCGARKPRCSRWWCSCTRAGSRWPATGAGSWPRRPRTTRPRLCRRSSPRSAPSSCCAAGSSRLRSSRRARRCGT
ncbi:AAA family ATPase [Saccharopolyspora spinosporotrichia]